MKPSDNQWGARGRAGRKPDATSRRLAAFFPASALGLALGARLLVSHRGGIVGNTP